MPQFNDERSHKLYEIFQKRLSAKDFFNEARVALPTIGPKALLGHLWTQLQSIASPGDLRYLEMLLDDIAPSKKPEGFISYEIVRFRFDHAMTTLLQNTWSKEELQGRKLMTILRNLQVQCKIVDGTMWYRETEVNRALEDAGKGMRSRPAPEAQKPGPKPKAKPAAAAAPAEPKSDNSALAKLYFEQHKAGVIDKAELMELLKGIK